MKREVRREKKKICSPFLCEPLFLCAPLRAFSLVLNPTFHRSLHADTHPERNHHHLRQVLPGARRPCDAPGGRPHRPHRPQGGDPGPLRPRARRHGQGGHAGAHQRPHALLLHPGAGPGQGGSQLQLPGGAREPLVAPGQEAEPGRHLLQRQGDAGGGHQEGHHDPHRPPRQPRRRAGFPGPHRQGGEGDGAPLLPLLRAVRPGRREDRRGGPGGERRLHPPLPAGEGSPAHAPIFGLHAAFTISDKTMAKAAETGPGAWARASMSTWPKRPPTWPTTSKHYGKRVVERLEAHGILGEKTMAAHCVHINQHEVEILARTGTMVATQHPEQPQQRRGHRRSGEPARARASSSAWARTP